MYNRSMLEYFVTYLLIIANVIVFMLIRSDKLDADDLGVSYHLVYNRKQYYRIFTAAFTHVEPMHLLMNMVSLYNVGTFVESLFGHWRMLVIYFGSLVLGKLLALAIRHNNSDDYTVSIGASGAICGILGASMLFILYALGINGVRYLLRPAVSLIMVSMLPGVDGTSHFSCMAAGMAIACLFIYL